MSETSNENNKAKEVDGCTIADISPDEPHGIRVVALQGLLSATCTLHNVMNDEVFNAAMHLAAQAAASLKLSDRVFMEFAKGCLERARAKRTSLNP